jgi:hypothetical protein
LFLTQYVKIGSKNIGDELELSFLQFVCA